MRIFVDLLPDFRSPTLPDSVATYLRKIDGSIDSDRLASIDVPTDSNLDYIGEEFGCEIVADGTTALTLVVDGLSRRLAEPVIDQEKLRLE